MQGFISLHRKLKDNAIWADPNYLKLWIYCLFEATHKKHDQLVGNQIVNLKRGQFVKGRFSLAEEMNKGVKPKQRLNDKTWWRYLENLESWGMLTIKSTNKYSVVTIDNYDLYQDSSNGVKKETDQQKSNKSPTDDQQLSTNNNGNNGNNKYSAEFEEFWKVYPKKADKGKSYKSFKAKRKKHSLEVLVEGAKKYSNQMKKDGTEIRFIKNGSTFLNNDSFLDEYEEQKQQAREFKKSPEQIAQEELVRKMRGAN